MSGDLKLVNDDGLVVGMYRQGDKIVRRESIEANRKRLASTDEYMTWNLESFFKGHTGELRKQLANLSTPEKAFLFCMATYVGYEDCCLKHDNGCMLTFDDMVSISGMSRGQVSNVINSLIGKDIIFKGKNSQDRQYFINPWLFCKGQRINKVLQTMFRNYKVKILGGKRWKDVQEQDKMRDGGEENGTL